MGHTVIAQDPDAKAIESVATFSDVDQAMDQGADAVLICSPSSFHLSQAVESVKRGMHVFVEKPLSHNLEGTEALAELAKNKDRTVLVACNLRFFPSLLKAKELVDSGRIGRAMAARIHGGFYLPSWRPATDYRQGYGARSDLGGGVVLDFSHDLDYLRWFFGHPSQAVCWSGKLSGLEIDTEDLASIQYRFPSGAVAQLQFDYLQPTYRRGMELVGDEGTLIWDYTAQSVQLFGQKNNQSSTYHENINTDLNSMYIDELEHFIRCIEGSDKPMVDASDGRAVVEMAEAARLSSEQGRVVNFPLESQG